MSAREYLSSVTDRVPPTDLSHIDLHLLLEMFIEVLIDVQPPDCVVWPWIFDFCVSPKDSESGRKYLQVV
jgi:hypothetical protein